MPVSKLKLVNIALECIETNGIKICFYFYYSLSTTMVDNRVFQRLLNWFIDPLLALSESNDSIQSCHCLYETYHKSCPN